VQIASTIILGSVLREQRRRDFKKAKAKKASEINNKAD